MRSILTIGILAIAMTFCNLGERLKQLSGSGSSGTSHPGNTSNDTSGGNAESPVLTSEQQAIQNAAEKVTWTDQGITWSLPKGWKNSEMKKESALFSSPDNAFLIPTISVMNDDFPSEISLKATYDSALQQMKNGKYENARYLAIDGIKGVEWTETMPEDKNGPRRHQWIAFRNYLGQKQQLNIMLSTKGNNFDKHRDDFAAIMYSMKIDK